MLLLCLAHDFCFSVVDLSAALNSESLKTILDNPEFMEALSKHVPEIKGKEPTEEVKDSVKSPQFQQVCSGTIFDDNKFNNNKQHNNKYMR
jgi:hypothetical protein